MIKSYIVCDKYEKPHITYDNHTINLITEKDFDYGKVFKNF